MSETDSIFDVAIVGYGPTGATAANILGQAGLRVVVLERDPDIYGRARAISTDEEVMRIWQSVGLADELQESMLPGGVVAFVDADGRPFSEVSPPSRGAGHPAQQFIYQPAVDGVLRKGADRFPNVTILTRHEALKVKQDGESVEVLAANLVTDEFVRIRASYVIAADGGSSAIRGILGVGYAGKTFSERWVVIDTEVLQDWPGSSRLRFHCNPKRPAVDCPTPLDHHRWEFPVRADEDEDELVKGESIWRVLNDQGITDQQVKILRAVIYSHHVRFADRWRVGRVFLAGDAAHAMPPWIGQGMAAGVRDAANLCWKLEAVIRGNLDESVLHSYQTERDPHVRETTDHAVFSGRLITERREWVAAIRNVTMRGLNRIPGFAKWIVATHWIPNAHYPKGFVHPTAHKARGWQLPQPDVIDDNGTTVRFDDTRGKGWTVLTTSATPRPTAWSDVAVPTIIVANRPGTPGSIVDATGILTTWLREHDAETVAIRPDGFVYAAASPGTPLPPPPGSMKMAS